MVSLAGLTRSHSGGTWRGAVGGWQGPRAAMASCCLRLREPGGRRATARWRWGAFSRYRRGRPSAGAPHLCAGQRFGFKVEKATKRRHEVSFRTGPRRAPARLTAAMGGGARGGARGSASTPLGELLPPRAALRRGCRVGGVRPLRGCLRLAFIAHWWRSEGRRDFRAFFDRPLEGEEEGGGLWRRPSLRL